MSACQVVDQQKSLCYPSRLRMSLLILVVLMSGLAMMAQVQAADGQSPSETVVGRVTLAIGQGQIIHDNDTQDQARTGTLIREGDQVVTRSNGHVHIRFIDDGLVSVRPNSRLDVERYQYNPDHPEDSTIRFNLEEGVTRAVSGKGAKAARDRYRMNTPIAAIGVRGTDYILSASADRIRAFVNEGAIVMASFSDHCLASGLGPCNDGGIELRGGSNQVLELDRLSKQPRLLQMELDEALTSRIIQRDGQELSRQPQATDDQDSHEAPSTSDPVAEPDPTTADPATGDPTTGMEPPELEHPDQSDSGKGQNGQKKDDDDEEASSAMVMKALALIKDHTPAAESDNDANQEQGMGLQIVLVDDGNSLTLISDAAAQGVGDADQRPLKPEDLLMMPQIGGSDGSLLPDSSQRQLVWGYWGDAAETAPDFFFPYEELVEKGYVAKVNNPSLQYRLMRRSSDSSTLMPGLGTVNFALHNAAATLTSHSGDKTDMGVSAGALRIDFAKGSFATLLQMDSQQTGQIEFVMSGAVSDNGLFQGHFNNSSSALGGATSLDGQEAAYMFWHNVAQGRIDGITLWGARP